MNLHGRAPRAALIREHVRWEEFTFWRLPFFWRLAYAEGTMTKTEKRRAQWLCYNGSLRGHVRERLRNATASRAAYMQSRGLARTATIQAGRIDGTAYQSHSGRWRA